MTTKKTPKPKALSQQRKEWLTECANIGWPKRGRTLCIADARAILAVLAHKDAQVLEYATALRDARHRIRDVEIERDNANAPKRKRAKR